MQEITLNPVTVILLAVIIAWAVWAVRRILGKGLCDCHSGCEGCSKSKKKKCPSVEMAEKLDKIK
jgi:hypothetical protein